MTGSKLMLVSSARAFTLTPLRVSAGVVTAFFEKQGIKQHRHPDPSGVMRNLGWEIQIRRPIGTQETITSLFLVVAYRRLHRVLPTLRSAPPGQDTSILTFADIKMPALVSSFAGTALTFSGSQPRKTHRVVPSAKAIDVDVNLAPPTTRIPPRVPEGKLMDDGQIYQNTFT